MDPLFGFLEGMFKPSHLIVVMIVGVLLFGKRLPEIGRYLGQFVTTFMHGLRGIEDDIQGPMAPQQATAPELIRPPQRVSTAAPKFENNGAGSPAQPQL